MKRTIIKVVCMISALLLIAGSLDACKKNEESTTSPNAKSSQSAKTGLTSSAKKASGTAASKTGKTSAITVTNSASANSATNLSGNNISDNGSTSDGEQNTSGAASDNEGYIGNTSEDAGQVIDLKGVKFVVADRSEAPKEDGDVIQAALYKSWKNAEQKYNFTMEWKYVPGGTGVITNEFVQAMVSGIKYCDIINLATKQSLPTMVVSNLLAPIDDHIDFNGDPLFETDYIKTAGLWNGKHYGYNTPVIASGFSIFYNRDIFARENLQDPQDLIESGQWTWDAFLEAAQNTTKDLNGDGVIDQWGLECYFPSAVADALLFSNGCNYFSENNGQYTFALNESRAVKALQFMSDLVNVYNVMKFRPESGFKNGNAGMYIGVYLNSGLDYINIPGLNYGLLPLPKGPDVQDYQFVADGANNWCYPTNTNVRDNVLVMKDVLTIWDPSKPDHVSYDDYTSAFIAKWYNNPRDIELAKKAFTQPKVEMYRCFNDMLNMVNKQVHNQIYNLQLTPAAALDSIKEPAQQAIDLSLTGGGSRP